MIAKQYIVQPIGHIEPAVDPRRPPRYRRMRVRDIDRIIAATRELVSDLEVTQLQEYWPADDDGLWFFRGRPGGNEVQIESWNGDCPFIVEHDRGSEAYTETTVADVVAKVVELLQM